MVYHITLQYSFKPQEYRNEIPQIVSIIVRRVLLSMIARRQDRHLMPIDIKEIIESPHFLVYLSRTKTAFRMPDVYEFLPHGKRA